MGKVWFEEITIRICYEDEKYQIYYVVDDGKLDSVQVYHKVKKKRNGKSLYIIEKETLVDRDKIKRTKFSNIVNNKRNDIIFKGENDIVFCTDTFYSKVDYPTWGNLYLNYVNKYEGIEWIIDEYGNIDMYSYVSDSKIMVNDKFVYRIREMENIRFGISSFENQYGL